jgi:hypothetical protein
MCQITAPVVLPSLCVLLQVLVLLSDVVNSSI